MSRNLLGGTQIKLNLKLIMKINGIVEVHNKRKKLKLLINLQGEVEASINKICNKLKKKINHNSLSGVNRVQYQIN